MTPRLSGWPHYDSDEMSAVADCLASGRVNYWTGEQGRNFETEYASYLGVAHSIALMNGTVALELALRVWGVRAGDEVVVSPRSFMASVSCAVLQGATPVFADVDADSQCVTADSIARVLTRRTKVIIPVHLGGWPCDMREIMNLASQYGVRVLEDCAQAHGATCDGLPVGSFGNAAAFSFCQDKIITTGGEGGLLALKDGEDWASAWSFKDHGKNYESVFHRRHPPGFRWVHESFGTNWRMTELQAAIGRRQLGKLGEWTRIRRRNASILYQVLGSLSALRIPVPAARFEHAYYRFYTFVRPERLAAGWSRDRMVSEISEAGVPCFVGSCPEIYKESAFQHAGFRPATDLPTAKLLGETSIAFLVHPTLDTEMMFWMAETIAAVVRRATR